MGLDPNNFGLPRPFRSRVRSRHSTDRQTDGQTDRHRPSFYNAPPALLTEVWHNNSEISGKEMSRKCISHQNIVLCIIEYK